MNKQSLETIRAYLTTPNARPNAEQVEESSQRTIQERGVQCQSVPLAHPLSHLINRTQLLFFPVPAWRFRLQQQLQQHSFLAAENSFPPTLSSTIAKIRCKISQNLRTIAQIKERSFSNLTNMMHTPCMTPSTTENARRDPRDVDNMLGIALTRCHFDFRRGDQKVLCQK